MGNTDGLAAEMSAKIDAAAAELLARPRCDLWDGSNHEDTPAVVVAELKWTTRDGEQRHGVKALCRACYTDKVREFESLAREEGRRTAVVVVEHFAGGEHLTGGSW